LADLLGVNSKKVHYRLSDDAEEQSFASLLPSNPLDRCLSSFPKEFKLSKVSSVPSFQNTIKSQHFTQLPVVVFCPSLVLQMLKIVQLCVTIVMSCLN